ncbi:hypothetical protein LJR129_000738 [Acidovorax sp. LjRoot129]|uniref:hypothetical protein n=1 Tax=Acidovorax sp. LjRoot129 TaxID=3342260 RepID=UPI003ECE15F2
MSVIPPHTSTPSVSAGTGADAGSAAFSLRRFTLLTRAHWAEHRRQYLGHLLVTGILYCVLLVFVLALSNGDVFTTSGQSALYFWGLYLTGFVFAGRYFDGMSRRESALLALMRPASVLEKWLLCVAVVVVAYPLCYTLLFLAISWPAQGMAMALRAMRLDSSSVSTQDYGLFVPLLRQPVRDSLLTIAQQWGFFIAAWALQAVAVTGSLYFRGAAMLKTLVLGVALSVVTALIAALADSRHEVFFAWWMAGAGSAGTSVNVLNACLWVVLPVLLWWQTYQHLREKELT